MTFLTEYKFGGLVYCERVEADTWEEAEKIAKERDPRERVVGVLVLERDDNRGLAH